MPKPTANVQPTPEDLSLDLSRVLFDLERRLPCHPDLTADRRAAISACRRALYAEAKLKERTSPYTEGDGEKKKRAKEPEINVGDWVKVKFGTRHVKGIVVEDRGSLGFKGRKLYKVLVNLEDSDAIRMELPADELRVYRRASAAKHKKRQPAKKKTEKD